MLNPFRVNISTDDQRDDLSKIDFIIKKILVLKETFSFLVSSSNSTLFFKYGYFRFQKDKYGDCQMLSRHKPVGDITIAVFTSCLWCV